ncbi:MAG TPA: serine hydrolase [Thermoleophilaceae bacterium]
MLVAALSAAPAAHAAKSCAEPGATWDRATPAEAGLDAAKLQEAIDYGSTQESFAIRVYRHGCLVGEDRAAAANSNTTFESWSMAKSVVSLIFGRAMAKRLISPDDPVGSLLPEADGPHGAITMRDLLTMTSGLYWNGFRDYNIFTQPDRVHDALTLPVAHPPGTYFEYAQSTVALLAEAISRSAGEDVQEWAQRELMDPLGIPAGSWRWERDRAGHVQGFWGVNMRPDDFGRLGELMRRGGKWRGRRLLAKAYMRQSIAPSRTNGCYGWLHWLNAAAPCVGPTITERPVEDDRDFPDLPADMYQFSGLFGQRVTQFPSLGIVFVRTGQDPGLVFAGDTEWEHGLYTRLLAAVVDQKVERPGPPPRGPAQPEADYGFQTAIREPDQYGKGLLQDPLPPPGPQRARAAQLWLAAKRATGGGVVSIGFACPGTWPGHEGQACTGTARLAGATRALAYDLPAGRMTTLRFRLAAKTLRSLRRSKFRTLQLTATNGAVGGPTPARVPIAVKRPLR